jgi:hypothetical protein
MPKEILAEPVQKQADSSKSHERLEESPDSRQSADGRILQLQRAMGNRRVGELIGSGQITRDGRLLPADAIAVGAPLAIGSTAVNIHRDQDPSAVPTANPAGIPGGNPVGLPGVPGGLFAPNADANGVVYDVPDSDYRKDVTPAAPPLDAPMPQVRISVPDKIPGWKAAIPPSKGKIGPFEYDNPGNPSYIVTQHSQSIQSAWDYYRFHNIQDLQSQWDDAAPRIDSFTQAKKGDPTLDAVVTGMKQFNLQVAPGKGTVSQQVGAHQVDPGSSVSQVAKATADAGESFGKGLEKTGAPDTASTVGTPVQQAVTELQGARSDVLHHMGTCKAEAKIFAGLVETQRGFGLNLKARELNQKAENQEAEKKDIENGQQTLKKLSPQLARFVADCQALYEPLNKLVIEPAKGVAEKLETENYPGAALDAAKAVLAVVKWQKIEAANRDIANLIDGAKSALDQSALALYEGAQKQVTGEAEKLEELSKQAEAKFLTEKAKYENLAAVVRKNWKGENKGDAELAAKALEAIPVVQKLIRFLGDVQKTLPTKLPEPGFNSGKAYTLATKGVGAPGAADLLQVAGYILGVRKAIDDEVTKWSGMLGQLQMVATKLGVQ